MEELVAEVDGHVERLKEPITLLGHSWGTALAVEYLKSGKHAKRIRALILIAPLLDLSYEPLFEKKFAATPKWQTKLPFKKQTIEHVPIFFTQDFWEKAGPIYDSLDICEQTCDELFKSYLANVDLRPFFRTLRIPILNVYAMQDVRIPAEYTKTISLLNENVESAPISRAGHFPFIEKPEECEQVIRAFLGRALGRNR